MQEVCNQRSIVGHSLVFEHSRRKGRSAHPQYGLVQHTRVFGLSVAFSRRRIGKNHDHMRANDAAAICLPRFLNSLVRTFVEILRRASVLVGPHALDTSAGESAQLLMKRSDSFRTRPRCRDKHAQSLVRLHQNTLFAKTFTQLLHIVCFPKSIGRTRSQSFRGPSPQSVLHFPLLSQCAFPTSIRYAFS